MTHVNWVSKQIDCSTAPLHCTVFIRKNCELDWDSHERQVRVGRVTLPILRHGTEKILLAGRMITLLILFSHCTLPELSGAVNPSAVTQCRKWVCLSAVMYEAKSNSNIVRQNSQHFTNIFRILSIDDKAKLPFFKQYNIIFHLYIFGIVGIIHILIRSLLTFSSCAICNSLYPFSNIPLWVFYCETIVKLSPYKTPKPNKYWFSPTAARTTIQKK